MKLSLRVRLSLFWLVIVVICVALGVIMHRVYSLGVDAQTARMRDIVDDACETIHRQYTLSLHHQGVPAPLDIGLAHAVSYAVLRDVTGVEGGLWREHDTLEAQFVAYVFPTHAGSEEKKDVPQTERARLTALARQSLAQRAPLSDNRTFRAEVVVTHACPMLELSPPLVAWTMARVQFTTGAAYDQLRLGLGVLFFFSLASGLVFAIFLIRWSRRFTRLTTALARHSLTHMPDLAPTGDAELDRIVSVVNDVSARLTKAQAEAQQAAAALARADRLAALGRMAAGLAHEIRNPLATMRLKAENALAQPHPDAQSRQAQALQAMLGQIDRLEHLVRSLLTMTQPLQLHPQCVHLGPWLEQQVAAYAEQAQAAGVQIETEVEAEQWCFDPLHLGRAVENLLSNALHHTSCGGVVRIAAHVQETHLRLRVSDTGSGIAPEVLPRLFEPFVTSRANGTGLGLALVREIAVAHGGSVRLVCAATGACFEIEIPWLPSSSLTTTPTFATV
jgi:signal transduction histidine kinase